MTTQTITARWREVRAMMEENQSCGCVTRADPGSAGMADMEGTGDGYGYLSSI